MKKLFKILFIVCLLFGLTGCSDEAFNVKHNIGVESNNFNTYRKVTVMNLRSDKILLEIEGFISIQNSATDELAIVIKTGEKDYKMHYVYIGSEIVYLVEQLENTSTDAYHWKIRVFAVVPELEVGRN